ncbi:MAG: hypothetical protein AB7K35_10050 [Pseudorhodoplanes sp.]
MRARSYPRRAIGLAAAYALALQAIFGLSLGAAAQAAPGTVLCAVAPPAQDGALPPGALHDCAAACLSGGCGAPLTGALPDWQFWGFDTQAQCPPANAETGPVHTAAGTLAGARSPPL